MISRLLISIFGLTLISGCSTVPRQEDVTGEDTTAIVQKLRCEAGQALNDLTVELLRNPAFDATPETMALADRIESRDLPGTDLIKPENARFLTEEQVKLFRAYTLSAVTFDFRFNIQENNKNSISLTPTLPFNVARTDVFSLALGANADFQRQTENSFQVTNTFYSLHREYDLGRCDHVVARYENIIFPITGRVGIDNVFRTYVGIDSMRTIYKPESKYRKLLTFTTTHGASTTPSVKLDPIASRFRLNDAEAILSASRIDVHEVNIEIARGELAKGQSFMQALKLEAARRDAAAVSLINANSTRTENLFIIPGRSLNPFLR